MKKILVSLATLAIMVVCFVLLPVDAQAANGTGRIGDCTWVREGTTLTISGNGRMGDLQPWGQNVTHVIIEEGVTNIGQGAFMQCPLEYVSIASTVKSIGLDAFKMSGLTSIIIPEGVTSIGEQAFASCRFLEYIELPSTLTTIGRWAFAECGKLKSIVLPASITKIDSYAFNYCNIEDVWYLGSASDKASLSIGGDNLCLSTATWHYNSCPIGAPHAYNGACDNSCNACGEIRNVPDHTYDSACDNCCNGCGELRTVPDHTYDNACDAECNICGNIRSVSHMYGTEWVMTNANHWHECSICGDKKDVAIHDYSNACDADCNSCGYGRTITHSYESTWSTDAINHWHECNICGDKKDKGGHTPGAPATESTAQTCTTCDYIIQPVLNHTHNYGSTWTMNGSGHWHACVGCEEKGSYTAHTPGTEATATTDQTCTVCGYVLKEATGETEPAPQPTEPSGTEATQPESTPATPTEPTTTPVAPTEPSGTEATQPESTPVTPTEPVGGDEPSTDSLVWIIIAVAVVLFGGGAAGIIIWKKH